jgi:hypothetical protein
MLRGRCSTQALRKLQQHQNGQTCVETSRQSSESPQLPQMLHGHRLLLRLQQHVGTWQVTCHHLQQQLQYLLLVTCRCAW